MKPVDVLITDLDNTLWDWVGAWHAWFTAQIDVLVEQGDLNRQMLLQEAKEIHRRQRTTEYSLLLAELPSLASLAARKDVTKLKELAAAAAQEEREKVLCLYPETLEVLSHVRAQGTLVVAYTESMAFATAQRIRKLKLDGVIQYLYSSPDHDFPADTPPQSMRKHADDYYALKRTEHRHVEKHVTKPNADVLRQIMRDVGADPARTAYVGDNLLKDISMAQQAGVHDVHVEYGQTQHLDQYQLLREVTHWTPEDVEKESAVLADDTVRPTYVLRKSLSELLEMFQFESHNGARYAG